MSRPDFWTKVERGAESECWSWLGFKDRSGHGLTSHKSQPIYASRKAWVLTHGEIPQGLCVNHRCDNAACCNPAHLYLGTRADNMVDLWGKTPGAERRIGRLRVLTDEQLQQMWEMRRKGATLRECASAFGVHIATVCRYITAVRKQRIKLLQSARLSRVSQKPL